MMETRLETPRLTLRTSDEGMGPALVEYLSRNAAHFAASSPKRSEEPNLTGARESLSRERSAIEGGTEFRWYLFERGTPERIAGNASLTNIVRGVFQACHFGYRIDHSCQGQGLMREALTAIIEHAFGELNLHRLMANYVPMNERSGRLLRRLGFVIEGYARDYLLIDGVWRDHILTSLVRNEGAGNSR